MNANWCICGLVTALAILASPTACAQKPLRMDLAPLMQPRPAATVAPRATVGQRAATRRSFSAPQPAVTDRDRRLTDRNEARADAIPTLAVRLLPGQIGS